MALITVSQLQALYPSLVGTDEDTRLGTVITWADSLMAAFCGFPPYDGSQLRTLEDQTYTLYLDGPSVVEPARIDLGIRPVVSISSAYVDTAWDYGSDTQVASGDMVLDKSGRIWLRPDASSSWASAPRANKITVVAGFTTTPPDLVVLAATAVRALIEQLPDGLASVSLGSQSSSRVAPTSLLPDTVRAGLAPYVLWGSRAG